MAVIAVAAVSLPIATVCKMNKANYKELADKEMLLVRIFLGKAGRFVSRTGCKWSGTAATTQSRATASSHDALS